MAQAFDAASLQASGPMLPLGDEPRAAPGTAAYDAGRRVSASTTGSLAFIPDPAINTSLRWVAPTGAPAGTISVPAGRYLGVSIAPDNSQAVLVRRDADGSRSMWLVDLTRASAAPLGSIARGVPAPVWSRDGRRVAFAEMVKGQRQLSEKTVADSSPARRIVALPANGAYPRDWPNGEILITQIDPGTKWNLYRMADSGATDPVVVFRSPAIEAAGWVSPDGKWLLYVSDEGGRLDAWVQPFPNGGAKVQISTGGTSQAWWNRDGKDVLYLRRDQTLWRVVMNLSPGRPPQAGPAEQLGTFPASLVSVDLAVKSQRFLALIPERATIDAVTIIQSWRAALPASR